MADERKEIAKREETNIAKDTAKKMRTLVPPVDIYEDNEKIVLLADMPGVSKDGLDIQIEKNVLSINGKIENIVPEEAKPIYVEFGGNEYARSFTIGPEVDVNRIQANLNAGVLKLILPKAEEVKPKKIEVKVA